MALIYRAMRADGDSPMVGHTKNDTLGVREGIDIQPIQGVVQPSTGGMSVSPSLQELPPHLVPKRLRKHGYPDARRSNTLPDTFPWRMGVGPFTDGQLCDGLQLRIDPSNPAHGFVEPDRPLSLEEYRVAIEATRPAWVREEW